MKKESYFWTSYSDLMTTMFFVMLVLFVLTIALQHKSIITKENQLKKIKEIEKATNNIDTTYFEYKEEFKKHKLKIEASFRTDRFKENDIDNKKLIVPELINAGNSISDSVKAITKRYPKIQYLLIIEGQASRDRATEEHNYELSYKRAYTLKRIWDKNNIDFGDNCEVLISGSGTGGTMRDINERANQRFLIHILPKPGIIEASKEK
jgi:hypothetical protein